MRASVSRALSGALLLLAVLAVPAGAAGKWVTKEIQWQKTSQGSQWNGTAINTRDTTHNVIAAGQTDTTGGFTLSQAAVWRRHDGAATSVDTAVVAYLIIQSDSSGVSAGTLSSLTYEIDGRVGGYRGNDLLSNWTQVDSTVATFGGNPAGGVYAAPIRAISGLGTPDAGVGANFFYRLMAYDNLRIRITAAAGLVSAARVFVRYWDSN